MLWTLRYVKLSELRQPNSGNRSHTSRAVQPKPALTPNSV